MGDEGRLATERTHPPSPGGRGEELERKKRKGKKVIHAEGTHEEKKASAVSKTPHSDEGTSGGVLRLSGKF